MNRVRDPIDRHLAKLAPEAASAGFTARVMRRIEESAAETPETGSIAHRWAFAAAALAAVAVVFLLIRDDPAGRQGSESRSIQLAEMRKEHALLKQELGKLQSTALDTAPVIYLGTIDEVDYVWDLSPLLDQQADRAVPASARDTPTVQIRRELP
jgi:hypothetical protein